MNTEYRGDDRIDNSNAWLQISSFFPGEHVPGPPKTLAVSNRHDLGGIVPIVPILLDNPESWFDFSRVTSRSALTSQRAEKYVFVKLS